MRRLAILAIALPVSAGCVGLGFWQVARLAQRRDANARVRAGWALPPVTLGIDSAAGGHRRAVAVGAFDFTRQVVVEGRSFQGVPAVVVVTPLRLANGRAVLVERGWVPSPGGRQVVLDRLREPDSATVEGLLAEPVRVEAVPADTLTWPRRVRWADPVGLSGSYPYPLLPYVLRRTSAPSAGGDRGALRPVPAPPLDNGPHLSYAIQWFAFAAIALVGAVALHRRETRNEKRETGHPPRRS
jgi:surfeit locus 1 family protein